jgi:hypothetical protein
MAINRAVALGKKARTMKMAPTTMPTRRAAMPVTSAREMLVE